jgi:type VI secretion system protein ImpG
MDGDRYQGFLTELAALDEFFVDRRRDQGFVQREDPDVRRLLESLAFFSARTREAAAEQLRSAVERLVHGHLDDFLVPQPTRGLVRAVPGPRLTDPVSLPRGTRVRLRTLDDNVAMFTTTRNLTIRPLQLDWAELRLRGRRGYRIMLRIRSRGVTREVPEPLSLHISHLDDYPASLRLFTRLRRHLQAASVVYDQVPTPDEVGEPCRFSLGAASADTLADVAGGRYRGPTGTVAGIREFFHQPTRDLYLELLLAPAAKAWRQAWLCLDLDEEWPADQVINQAMFGLFVVPIENLFTEPAEPIKADGTRSSHPLRSWQPELEAAFHSVVEVTQQTPAGSDVIMPAYLATGRESYDLAYESGSPSLLLRLPDAFAQPRVVSVQARWYQPWFDGVAVGKLRASLQTRHVEGVALEVQGDLRPHEVSPLWRDASALLQVMSRRSKRILSRNDIVNLMAILGANERGYHGDVAADVLHVETREEPADRRRSAGGVAYVYRLILADADEDRQGLQEDYVRRVGELADAWSSNPVRIELHRRATRDRGPEQGARG